MKDSDPSRFLKKYNKVSDTDRILKALNHVLKLKNNVGEVTCRVQGHETSTKEHAVVCFYTNQAVSGSEASADPDSARKSRKKQKQVGKKWKTEKRQKDSQSGLCWADPGLLVSLH